MSVLFIAGAGTDIGKTYVTAALIRALRDAGRPVRALKPVASGMAPLGAPGFASSDTAVLLDAQGLTSTAETVASCSPWRFEAPLAPDMAAAAEGRALLFADILGWSRDRLAETPAGTALLIEGVGGVMSPVAADATNLDWIAALGCPALLVAGSYLGAISHALSALVALRSRGIEVAGVVVNQRDPSETLLEATAAAIGRFGGGVAVTPLTCGGALPPSLAPGG